MTPPDDDRVRYLIGLQRDKAAEFEGTDVLDVARFRDTAAALDELLALRAAGASAGLAGLLLACGETVILAYDDGGQRRLVSTRLHNQIEDLRAAIASAKEGGK